MKMTGIHIRKTAARLAPVLVAAALAAGCGGTLSRIGIGGGGGGDDGGSGADVAAAGVDGQIDLRNYAGTGYCPVVEVRDGTQAIRKYVRASEPTPQTLVWQAAITDTARECRDDPGGTMSIRVGVSGRLLAGPKGGPSETVVPVRVVVVKYREAVLFSQLYKEQVTIGADNSASFRKVYDIEVPSPGADRDYLIYVGFDG